jgi:selenide,water dikinase
VDDGRRTTNDGFPVHALTDVTGFGLIGHLREMLLASENVSATIHADQIPLLEGALDCVRAGYIPGGLKANREFAECLVQYDEGIAEELKTTLFDPQTAGGLLIAVDAKYSPSLKMALNSAGVPSAEVGEILPKGHQLITVRM